LNTAAAYVPDRATAEGAIKRQLGTVSPESMTTADLATLANRVTYALRLYVPDASRRDEMAAKIKALV
jgi:hypothetical protein